MIVSSHTNGKITSIHNYMIFKKMRSENVLATTKLSNRYLKFDYSVAFFMQFLYTPQSCCYCAIDPISGDVVAAISGRLRTNNNDSSRLSSSSSSSTKSIGHIYTLVVDPGYRRMGLGRRLVDLLIAEFQQLSEASGQQLTDIVLESLQEDEISQSFYQTLGFQIPLVSGMESLSLDDGHCQSAAPGHPLQVTLKKTLCV